MAMRTMIGAILLILLLVGGFLVTRPKDEEQILVPPDEPTEWQTYTDPSGSVSVSYPPVAEPVNISSGPTQDWKVHATKANGTLLADIRIQKPYMSGTNFSDARFRIGRSADADEIRNCTVVQDNFSEKEDVTIEGYPFVQMEFIEAATGNLYETTSYRGIFDGDCYVIEYTIHSTNLANYPAEQEIKEFDKDEITDILERMKDSVRFLISSD